jgi:hypothetical protein
MRKKSRRKKERKKEKRDAGNYWAGFLAPDVTYPPSRRETNLIRGEQKPDQIYRGTH